MAKKPNGTAPSEQFVKLPRDVLGSDAWRSLGINELRLIHFLMLEHMRHGGKSNGNLKAPYRQLVDFGVSARYIAAAIRAAEASGLVICERGGMRTATRYALAWLPLHDGTLPNDGWRRFRDPALRPFATPKFRNLPDKGNAGLPYKGNADGSNLLNKGNADGPGSIPDKGNAPYRIPLPGESNGDARAAGVVPLRAAGKGGDR